MQHRYILSILFLVVLCKPLFAQHEAILNTKVETSYEVKKIKGLNSSYSDFSPVIMGKYLLFASDRDFDYVNWGENRWKKKKFLNVFSSEIRSMKNDSALVSGPRFFMKELEGINHTGPLSVSPDGKFIVFTQVMKNKHQLNKPALYFIENKEGKWTAKEKFSFCNENYSYGHPALSFDGKYLFFSSDMPGTTGGKDVFYCIKTGEGWSEPQNAGANVNTTEDDVFPYFVNNVLYFSSKGRNSSGGLDLYKSYFSGNDFTPAENLGKEINSGKDDFGLVITSDFKNGFFSSNREGGEGEDDIYFLKITETAVVESKDLLGRFTYRNLEGGAGELDVLLVDDSGNVVLKAKTNPDGEFAFRNLPVNENYTIRLIQPDPDLKLEVIDRDGKAIAILRSDQNGSFIYKKLDPALSGTLGLMETEETSLGKTGKLSGQFVYEKLPGVYPDGLDVYLVDDSGNVAYRTKTDNYGNFTFRQLSLEKNYIMKTDSISDDVLLLIYNRSENVLAEFRKESSGEYVFRKLNSNAVQQLQLIENNNDTSMLAKTSVSLAGQFKYRSLDGSPSNMLFKITDQEGKVLYNGKTDEKGFFRVRDLTIEEEYIFLIDANDPNFSKKLILDLFNRSGRSMAMLENDKTGRFVYKRLKQEFSYLSEISTQDEEFLDRIPNIYFDKNSSTLSAEAMKTLDRLVRVMKQNPKVKIEIGGFADSRADEEFNNWLSERRMKAARAYLITRGIAGSRVKGTFYGETRLVNGCKDGAVCEEDQHKMNRRCEFHYIQP